MLPYNRNLKQVARLLRTNMTDAERYLWAKIRLRQLNGYQFYRQKPIGDYIVDFFCPRAKLVIEVDGSQHFSEEMTEYDRIREGYLRGLGLRVLRFTNTDVLMRTKAVVESVVENMRVSEEEIPLSPPLQKGENRIPLSPPLQKGETEVTECMEKTGKPLPFLKGD